MALSVRDALELPTLADAQPRVLAGADHLDHAIRWVHVAELADIATLLKGGELLLTTGMGLRESATLRRRYVRQLAAAEVAGLVIELGRNFRDVPEEMLQCADEAGLPLVALCRETRFVEVTEQVHRAIIRAQYDLVDRVETLGREFSELLLAGASTGQILHELAEAVGNPVVLENSAHQVVGLAPQDAAATTLMLAHWEEHSRSGHEEAGPGAVHHCSMSLPNCTWAGIWLRNQRWGRLHVLESSSRLDEATTLLLDRAAVAVGLSVLSQQNADHLADREASAVIADLLTGRHGSAKELFQRARALGSDLSAGGLVALIVVATNMAALTDERRLTEQERQLLRFRIRTALREALDQHGCNSLLGLDGDRVMGVVAVPDHQATSRTLHEVTASLLGRLEAVDPALSVIVGTSNESSPHGMRRAFEEARIAAEFRHRSGQSGLCEFDGLGTYPLLLRLAQGPELAAFIESELGPLLQHDARTKSVLMPTLRAYLANAGRKTDTVEELGVQRRTLYARLARIEKVLGRDLDSQETRTRLTLALQGHDIGAVDAPR